MITILLNDNSFEQDIRELLMAFFPGEDFSHEEKDAAVSRITARGMQKEDGTFLLEVTERAAGEAVRTENAEFAVDRSVRKLAKNEIKRRLYRILRTITGTELPWGTLTGIRPTKIALTMLEEGKTEDEIREYMHTVYFTGEEKTELAIDVAAREKKLLSTLDYENGYSLYVGIPFCPTTCLYCSFTSFPIGVWQKKLDSYFEALFKELHYVAEKMKGRPLETVYFGGGTPTSLDAEHLDRLITEVKNTFPMDRVQEFTVEAGRPDSITEEKLRVLKKHGITRISINPQTMNQETLKLIGRHHTVDEVIEKFRIARELGMDNINMDIIVGLPGEDMEQVQTTLSKIRELAPDSLTVHSLAIKRAARLNTMKEQYKDYKITNTGEMIDETRKTAKEMGLVPYYLYRQKNMAGNFENVGYAAPGKECLYNILIMEEKQTIMACGAGTTTKFLIPAENRHERAENCKDVQQYIDRVDEMIGRKEQLFGMLGD